MASLEDQLAKIIAAGLESNPELRSSLAEALSSSPEHDTYTKSEANYRPADENSTESCGECAHYSDHHCDVVSGYIDRDHVSDHFEAKGGAAGDAEVDGADGGEDG